ncbi:MAG: hypothetical protein M3R08_11600, partial [Bacteroidota bacterium]|nr:hypothetical protein [Bacteroidota bacterium]
MHVIRTTGSLIILMAWISCSFVNAQDPSMPRYRITTIPTQLLFLEFPIIVERMFGRHTIGLHGAYRPALIDEGEILGSGAYHLQNYWNLAYQSATGGLDHKYYLHDRFGLHIETALLYRIWWFDRKQISY